MGIREEVWRVSNLLVFFQNLKICNNVTSRHQLLLRLPSSPWCLPTTSPDVFQHQYLSFLGLILRGLYLSGTCLLLCWLSSENPSFLIYLHFHRIRISITTRQLLSSFSPSTPCDHHPLKHQQAGDQVRGFSASNRKSRMKKIKWKWRTFNQSSKSPITPKYKSLKVKADWRMWLKFSLIESFYNPPIFTAWNTHLREELTLPAKIIQAFYTSQLLTRKEGRKTESENRERERKDKETHTFRGFRGTRQRERETERDWGYCL